MTRYDKWCRRTGPPFIVHVVFLFRGQDSDLEGAKLYYRAMVSSLRIVVHFDTGNGDRAGLGCELAIRSHRRRLGQPCLN